VTLRVSSPQYFYQYGATPKFVVHAVSAGQQPCRFNMSPKFVSVVVGTSHQTLWDSADCAAGPASDMTVLAPGQPGVLRVSWNRKTSSPGCGGPQHLVRPGEYKLAAVAGRLHSARVNMVLGAKGSIGP
jgi:hypothetical protein